MNDRRTQNWYENWLARIETDAIPLFELLIKREFPVSMRDSGFR
jgi:hypothetical protein